MAIFNFQRPEPVSSGLELLKKNNVFVVRNTETNQWDYYKCKVGGLEKNGKFFELLVAPPFIADGMISVNKQYYLVTKHDILRRKINVAAKFVTNDPARTASSTNPSMGSAAQVGSNQSGASNADRQRLSEDVDLAWEEQMRVLLHLCDPQEGWQLPEDSQSPANTTLSPV